MSTDNSFKDKKVITIGVVSELTGLSERQIRYYEERKLIFPERKEGKNRKYSFNDIENLIDIANKIEEGTQTFEIRQDMIKKQKLKNEKELKRQIIQGQLNAHFGIKR